MNRREFCQTAALFFASSLCTGATLRCEERTTRFRAKKVFLESWNAENVRENSLLTAAFVQKKMEFISGHGCNGLILIPDQRSVLRWKKLIEAEGDRLGITVFLPTRLTENFLRQVLTVTPLTHEAGIFQCTGGKPADNGGFLLFDETDNVLGLVLYDSSRCLWTGFAPPDNGTVQDSAYSTNDSRLVAAQWIDHFRAIY